MTILTYHAPGVRDALDHWSLLASIYSICSFEECIQALESDAVYRLPLKPLAITLDDGHQSNRELLPVLERLDIPITIFLCSGIVDTRRHYWWLEVADPAERQALKKVGDDERRRMLGSRGHSDALEYATRHALDRDDLNALMPHVNFQAHTVFHPILTQCNADVLEYEIRQSRIDLESNFGLDVWAFAYPNGSFGTREKEVVRSAGYRCAVTTAGGFNSPGADMFELKRISIPDDAGADELIVRASGLWDVLQRLLGILRLRSN